MYVVATAGHVDHGKSTLVRALTGMEPDRWAEERRRGLTIDIGYAWTDLHTGDGAELTVAFVDVPGHQRFIGNMLAGLGPAPAVLFVVAADEGWSRQSEEHLAAVDALGISRGLLAVTRSDLADPQPVLTDALARLARSSLGLVPGVAVSGTTGEGLDELRSRLVQVLRDSPAPMPTDRMRLWIDRSFTVRGRGTVVTGTLAAGALRVGDDLELLAARDNAGNRVTVRGLQSLGRAVDHVSAPARVAVNLRGVTTDAVTRGDCLLSPGHWLRTDNCDVRLDLDAEQTSDLPAEGLVLHVGTAAVAVRVRPLGPGLARLQMAQQLPLAIGDRALLRDPGRQAVAAGVRVLDPDPPALRRRGAAAVRARELDADAGQPDLPAQVGRRGAVTRGHLARLGIPETAAVPPDVRELGEWLVSGTRWAMWLQAATALLADPAAGPSQPVPLLQHALDLPARPIAEALHEAVAQQVRPAAPPLEAEAAVQTLERRLAELPFAAPDAHELAALGLQSPDVVAAARAGRLLRLADGVVLLPSAVSQAAAVLSALPQPFTVSAARQALQTSRRVAVPLLEHLDSRRVTRKNPDQTRVVIRRS